jgi:hypothetical protein
MNCGDIPVYINLKNRPNIYGIGTSVNFSRFRFVMAIDSPQIPPSSTPKKNDENI